MLKRPDVHERVHEIQSLAARSAAAKCEELIGKARGMFIDRSDTTFKLETDLAKMTDEQLSAILELSLSLACNGDPHKIAETRKQVEAEAAAAAGQVVNVTAEFQVTAVGMDSLV